MILNPLVAVLRRIQVIINIPPFLYSFCIERCRIAVGVEILCIIPLEATLSHKRIWRSQLKRETEIRSLTWINLLVCRVTRQTQSITEVVRNTGIKHELISPILQFISLPAQLIVEDKIVVRPFKTLTDTCRKSIHLHILVIVQDIERKV